MSKRTSFKQKLRNAKNVAGRCACAVAIAASGTLGTLASAAEAYAGESAQLSIGADNYYAGYSTTWMWADGEMAYCVQPSKVTPSAGSYTKAAISSTSGRDWEVKADLWFGYGSPGFDASMWPSTWYDGSAITSEHYAALTHIILADTYSSDGNVAMFGCSAAFKSWCRQYVIGYGTSGELLNDNATGRLMAKRYAEVPSNFETFQLYTGSASQMIASFKYTPYGSVSLQKNSSDVGMSGNNTAYSLAAEYTLYKDSACTNAVGTIKLDTSGAGKLDEVEAGNYYLKETKAAPGFALDGIIYPITVESDKTTTVAAGHVEDTPQYNVVDLLVAKVDATTGKGTPQGDATLEGAEFSVEYYKGIYSSVEDAKTSGQLDRTWVLATDTEGKAYLNDNSKVSGDVFYYASDGETPVIPLGTLLITETKAPTGYNLDDGEGNSPVTHLVKVTSDNAQIETVETFNSQVSKDTVKRGDYRLVKEVATSIYSEGDGDSPQETKRVLVEGVQFQIINDSANTIVSPETGEEVLPGEVVCTITTDENGLATTKDVNAKVNGWQKPDSWTGALAYGTYTVHEVIPTDVAAKFKDTYGKTLLAVDDFKITISDEGQYDAPALVNNKIPQTPLKIVKVDAETGISIPLAASFEIYDAAGNIVSYTSRYPETHVMDRWTTNERGELTLPMLLEEGTYTLREVVAPEGYVLNTEDITFTVDAEYHGWDDPIVVTCEDMPQKATITVSKTDSETDEAVADSTYIVKACGDVVTPDGTTRFTDGEIVATITTAEDGTATTPELYLGTYTVYEAKAQDGYALDVVEKTVVLEYQGQNVSVFDEALDVVDDPTQIVINKVDEFDNELPVEGATFRIWNDEGTFSAELTSDEAGVINLKYIKHGTYHLQEVAAADGYVITDTDAEGNARIYDFTVNDQGMIETDGVEGMVSCYMRTITNMPKTLGTTAVDANSNTHEGQADEAMTIIDTVEFTGCIPGETYKVVGALMDKATGEALTDAEGKAITAETEFTAEDFTGTVEVTFTLDSSKLAGTSLVVFETMYDAEGEIYMEHTDLEDEGQTVNIVDVATQAHDSETGTNEGTVSDETTLVDIVSYEGLTPGNTYKLFTTLMDKETGEALTDANGEAIVAETTFTPEASDGEVEVELTLDTTELAGKSVVFFESLADAEDHIIAEHADLEDEGQTITFPASDDPVEDTTEEGKSYPKTGADAATAVCAASAAIIVGCGAAGAAYALNKRRKTKAADEEVEKSEAVTAPLN